MNARACSRIYLSFVREVILRSGLRIWSLRFARRVIDGGEFELISGVRLGSFVIAASWWS